MAPASSARDLFLSPRKKNFILKYFSSPFSLYLTKTIIKLVLKMSSIFFFSQFNLKEIFPSCPTNKTKYRGFQDLRECKYSFLIRFNLVITSNCLASQKLHNLHLITTIVSHIVAAATILFCNCKTLKNSYSFRISFSLGMQ